MIIYKDPVSTDDELFTDNFMIKEFMGCFVKVIGTTITQKKGGFDMCQLTGANPSAVDVEDQMADTADETVSGCDIVLMHELQSVPPFDKKGLSVWMRDFSKLMKKNMLDSDKTEKEITDYMMCCKEGFKYLKENLKNFEFYQSASQNPDGAIGFLDYEEIDGEERPYLLFFKHGFIKEKV